MNGCISCQYAKFELTATGKISRSQAGRCNFKPTIISSAAMIIIVSRTSIWFDTGEDCQVFEEKSIEGAPTEVAS